jgi:predicted transcriptional regulator
MARTNAAQLNIRSQFARDRVDHLARQTGMTATQIVEEALRTYHPPMEEPVPPGFIRKGRILVRHGGGRRITIEETLAAIDAGREERSDDIS